jgi:hypothetical protein
MPPAPEPCQIYRLPDLKKTRPFTAALAQVDSLIQIKGDSFAIPPENES